MKRIYAIILAFFTTTGLVRANNDDSTASNKDVTVFANDLSSLQGHLTVNGAVFSTLKAPVKVDGKICFEFDLGNSQHVKAWLITADSAALPYVPVSRKEYLDEARKELAGLKGADIRIIDSILHNSTARQLAQPAIVSVTAADFKGFEDGRANTTMLVRMNSAYFTGSEGQAPKCLLVCWRSK